MFFSKRILHLIPLLFIISILLFAMLLLIPGDPTYAILGQEASEEQREALRQELGLNDPVVVQYTSWLFDAVRGDFGRSLMTREPVTDILVRNTGATLQVITLAMGFVLVGGLGLGILSVMTNRKFWDGVFKLISNLGVAVPTHVVAVLMVLVFSVLLGWLPATGFVSVFDDPAGFLRTALLPALALAGGGIAIISLQIRSSLLETLEEDYIKTALSKGLSHRAVILRHGVQNSLLPVLTTAGVIVSSLIGGSVIVEEIFAIPGLGAVIVNSILQRDMPLLQGAILIVVLIVVVSNLAVDVAYRLVDPRIKL
ncbi:ABC transporter permease [Ornithinimicrobium cryptoxanthini]|uniref:ABC transporter permease n=1 Tax=Ornithinimicrobium cryptoxanthini TaxID=2934161 RepID=UPI002118BC11|nr:ABC transporter permease [Ornithinimicrobium cryptoxanthini]